MTLERMKQIARKWSSGYVCTLREGEVQEYHRKVLEMLEREEKRKQMHKIYSDSTLKSMPKENLIGIIRCYEHNISVLEERNDNQFKLLMEYECFVPEEE